MYKKPSHTNNPYEKPSHTNNPYEKPSYKYYENKYFCSH